MAKDAKIRKQQRSIAALKKHKKALQKKCAKLTRYSASADTPMSEPGILVDAGTSAPECLFMGLLSCINLCLVRSCQA